MERWRGNPKFQSVDGREEKVVQQASLPVSVGGQAETPVVRFQTDGFAEVELNTENTGTGRFHRVLLSMTPFPIRSMQRPRSVSICPKPVLLRLSVTDLAGVKSAILPTKVTESAVIP